MSGYCLVVQVEGRPVCDKTSRFSFTINEPFKMIMTCFGKVFIVRVWGFLKCACSHYWQYILFGHVFVLVRYFVPVKIET